MARDWNYWYPDLLVHVPGAPDPLLDHALRRAAREFFRRTRAWTEWLDPQNTSGVSSTEYGFDLPIQSELVQVERVTVDGKPLETTAYRQLEADWTRHRDANAQALVTRDMSSFILVGSALAAGQAIQVQASLTPSVAATRLPDELASRYYEAITEGAKATLMLTPKADFYNPDLAAVAKGQFEQAIGKCNVDAYRSHTNQTPRPRVHWC